MNWKLAALGLSLITALLVAASIMGQAINVDMPGPVNINVPTASVSNIQMYGWVYTSKDSPNQYAPVIAQSIGTLNAPSGQTISKSVTIPLPNPLMSTCPQATVTITVSLTMNSANLGNVFMYAKNLTSTSGTLSGVTIVTANPPFTVNQTISSGTMNGLSVYAYYVNAGSLSYSGLSVKITPSLIDCSTNPPTISP